MLLPLFGDEGRQTFPGVFLWILANPAREGRGWCATSMLPTALAGRVRQNPVGHHPFRGVYL